jgi:NhaP-type Na+/H+ or K+/H+ antiporter
MAALARALAPPSPTPPAAQNVRASMVVWTAGIVLTSLVVNAPLLGPLMHALGLNHSTPAKRHMHT